MGEFMIECTLCGLSFSSEKQYDAHPCLDDDVKVPFKIKMEEDEEEAELEQEVQKVLDQSPITFKEEGMTFKEEPSDVESVDMDPLGITEDDPADEDYVKEELPDNLSEVSESSDPAKQDAPEADDETDPLGTSKQCRVCGKRFFRREDFLDHKMNAHKVPRPYDCKICKKRFTQKHYVALHMRVHTGERPYKCEICSNAYTHKTSYTIHMRIHNNERPYRCVICGKRCYDKSGLTSHMRSHTKETPYECDVCGRRFTHSKSLLVHRRNHTGEKPYKCRYCGKAFRHWHKHKIHIRLHTGERPYKCKICGKGFPRNDEVKRHMRSHQGIKSFKCSICSVYCATQASITGHIDLHHADLKPNNPSAPEKTVVRNSLSGTLGTKAPQPRTIYKPIASLASSASTVTTVSQTAASSSSAGTSNKRNCEVNTKTMSFKEYIAHQEKMLSEKGLIVKCPRPVSTPKVSVTVASSKPNATTTKKNALLLPASQAAQTNAGKSIVILPPQNMPPGGSIQLVLPKSLPGQTQTQSAVTTASSTSAPQLIFSQPSMVMPQAQVIGSQGVGNQQIILLAPSGKQQGNMVVSQPVSQPLLLLCGTGGGAQRLVLLPQQTSGSGLLGGQTVLMPGSVLGLPTVAASNVPNSTIQIKQEVPDPDLSPSDENLLKTFIKQEPGVEVAVPGVGVPMGVVIKQEPEEPSAVLPSNLCNVEIKKEPQDTYE